jgi:hypothetical protein
VTIFVGDSKTEYTVHKQILIEVCPFFTKCFGLGMAESATNKVNLPEEEAEIFDHFVEWVYYKTVPTATHSTAHDLIRAYVMADKFGMPIWQNRLMDNLMMYWRKGFVKVSEVSWILDHVLDTSPLYKYAMDQFAYDTGSREYNNDFKEDASDELIQYRYDLDNLCSEQGFSATWLLRKTLYFQRVGFDVSPSTRKCKYHVHKQGETCCEVGPRNSLNDGSNKRPRTD